MSKRGAGGVCPIEVPVQTESAIPVTAASARKRPRSTSAVIVGITWTLPGQNAKFSHDLPARASGLKVIIAPPKCDLFLRNGRRGAVFRGDFKPCLQVVQGPPAERRKARSEDEARVGEIGVG